VSTATPSVSDYATIIDGCGLHDRSERGKLAMTGAEVKSFLQGQVTNDIEGLEPGRGCYAAFLTPKGKMLGDLRVLNLGDELFLDTERVSLQGLFNMILRYIPYIQTNFVMGLDGDMGPEPFELTKKFIDLSPGAFPAYSLLSAFGRAAPMNLDYQRAGRVLPFPFHFLNNNHAMNVRPKHYSWPEFYDGLVDVYLVDPLDRELVDEISALGAQPVGENAPMRGRGCEESAREPPAAAAPFASSPDAGRSAVPSLPGGGGARGGARHDHTRRTRASERR